MQAFPCHMLLYKIYYININSMSIYIYIYLYCLYSCVSLDVQHTIASRFSDSFSGFRRNIITKEALSIAKACDLAAKTA